MEMQFERALVHFGVGIAAFALSSALEDWKDLATAESKFSKDFVKICTAVQGAGAT